MNSEQRLICQLVGASVLGAEMPAADVLHWESIHKEFEEQAIIALPAQILNKLPMPKNLLDRWQLELMTTSAKAIQLMHNQNELVLLLGGHKIPYAILKGVAAAKYYPLPWLRTMGDVDFIVLPKDYDRTRQLMLDHEFVPVNEQGSRHDSFTNKGVHYELHRYFSTTEDEAGRKLDEMIYRGIGEAEQVEVKDYSFRMLPEPINGLVLLSHIRQHLRSGLGLRQMIDWFMYVKSELRDEQWETFKVLSDQVGLTRLAKAATRAGQLFFGLDDSISWCKDAEEGVCEDLMDHIFRSGNFGKKDINNSNAVFAMTRLRQNFFGTLQSNGERNWQALKKHAWLKPLAWLYQLFRYAAIGLTSKGVLKKAKEDSDRSRDLAELMKKLEG